MNATDQKYQPLFVVNFVKLHLTAFKDIFCQNGYIQKGKGVDLRVEPACIKLCIVLPRQEQGS